MSGSHRRTPAHSTRAADGLPKESNAVEPEREPVRLHRRQRIVDVLRLVVGDFADEAQREMHVFRRDPARARHAGAQETEPFAQSDRQLDRHE